MNLCIDIGNTRAKLALFNKKNQLVRIWVRPDITPKFLKKFIKKHPVQRAILASVRRKNKAVKKILKQELDVFINLSPKVKLPVVNAYQTPKTLGKDRIAAAIGAAHLFPDTHCLTIDAGTCITYDFIDQQRHYWGGSILPGIDMRLKALPFFTAKLPLVDRKKPTSFIGHSTETSIQTGVLWGVLHETKGFIEQYSEKYSPLTVVFTGGDALYFESQLKNKIFAEPNLVLIGLNQILEYNV